MKSGKKLFIIVPCYNEEECLPATQPIFVAELKEMIRKGLASEESRVLFVDDGSRDKTWQLIRSFHETDPLCIGLRLKPNGGHQKAVMAGIMEALDRADVSISIDADLQDNIYAMQEMMRKYLAGAHIVCGVRNSRATDSFLKRFTARAYYFLMNLCGARLIFDHADYRLLDQDAMGRLCLYHDDALFLRGMVTRLNLPTATVKYDRNVRMAGESKYTLAKMLKLARDGFACGKLRPRDSRRPYDERIVERLGE